MADLRLVSGWRLDLGVPPRRLRDAAGARLRRTRANSGNRVMFYGERRRVLD